jgi:hypothetical protein
MAFKLFFFWVAYDSRQTPFHVPPSSFVNAASPKRQVDIRNDSRAYDFAMHPSKHTLDLESVLAG